MTVRYYYLMMSQIDMLENQVLEEILRERANYYWIKVWEIFQEQQNKLIKKERKEWNISLLDTSSYC